MLGGANRPLSVNERQGDANQRAMGAAGCRWGVLERQRAPVLLGDLLHHGEAEAGPLVSLGGDVGLQEAGAILLRQADAVVDDLDSDPIGLRGDDGALIGGTMYGNWLSALVSILMRGMRSKAFSSGMTTSVSTTSPSPWLTQRHRVVAFPVARGA